MHNPSHNTNHFSEDALGAIEHIGEKGRQELYLLLCQMELIVDALDVIAASRTYTAEPASP